MHASAGRSSERSGSQLMKEKSRYKGHHKRVVKVKSRGRRNGERTFACHKKIALLLDLSIEE